MTVIEEKDKEILALRQMIDKLKKQLADKDAELAAAAVPNTVPTPPPLPVIPPAPPVEIPAPPQEEPAGVIPPPPPLPTEPLPTVCCCLLYFCFYRLSFPFTD